MFSLFGCSFNGIDSDEKALEKLKNIEFSDYLKIDRIGSFFGSFDYKRFFLDGINKREELKNEINTLQKVVALRERYISEKNLFKKISLYNDILKTLYLMLELNYSNEEIKNIHSYIEELKQGDNKKIEFNNEFSKNLKKSGYQEYLIK